MHWFKNLIEMFSIHLILGFHFCKILYIYTYFTTFGKGVNTVYIPALCFSSILKVDKIK